VTQLLQRQQRDSQCSGIYRIVSTGKPAIPFRGAHKVRDPRVSSRKIFQISCIAIELPRLHRRKNCDASTNQIILVSVVNASSRQCWGLFASVCMSHKLVNASGISIAVQLNWEVQWANLGGLSAGFHLSATATAKVR